MRTRSWTALHRPGVEPRDRPVLRSLGKIPRRARLARARARRSAAAAASPGRFAPGQFRRAAALCRRFPDKSPAFTRACCVPARSPPRPSNACWASISVCRYASKNSSAPGIRYRTGCAARWARPIPRSASAPSWARACGGTICVSACISARWTRSRPTPSCRPAGAHAALQDMVSLFARARLQYEVRLLLDKPCFTPMTIATKAAQRKRLGINTFLSRSTGKASRADIRSVLRLAAI